MDVAFSYKADSNDFTHDRHTEAQLAIATQNYGNAANAGADECMGWYVAYTRPRQEYIAEANLTQQNFQTYLPLFKTFKQPSKIKDVAHDRENCSAEQSSAKRDAALVKHEPMFPRYVFFKPGNHRQSVATARSTRGVNTLVRFGADLATVPPGVLQTIRALEDQRNRAELHVVSPFQPGRRVRLCNSALNGMEGLVQATSTKRVMLLLEILGRQKTISVDYEQLEIV